MRDIKIPNAIVAQIFPIKFHLPMKVDYEEFVQMMRRPSEDDDAPPLLKRASSIWRSMMMEDIKE